MRDRTLSFFGRNQYHDWKIILGTFFIVFICVSIFSIVSFMNIGEEIDIFGSDSSLPTNKKINKEELKSMINEMDSRQKSFYELKMNKPVIGDPSI